MRLGMAGVQSRIRGLALDATFASEHPYRDGEMLPLTVPERVYFTDGWHDVAKEVSPDDRSRVGKAYHAVHCCLARHGERLRSEVLFQ